MAHEPVVKKVDLDKRHGGIEELMNSSDSINGNGDVLSSSRVDTVVPESEVFKGGKESNAEVVINGLEDGEIEQVEVDCWKYRDVSVTNVSSSRPFVRNSGGVSLVEDDVDSLEEDAVDSLEEDRVFSQSSICNNLVKINMGAKRGRQKKRGRRAVNPFDFKMSSRLGGKCLLTKGKRKAQGNLSERLKIPFKKGDDGAMENEGEGVELEAARIVDTALDMGLAIEGGREEGIKNVARRIGLNQV